MTFFLSIFIIKTNLKKKTIFFTGNLIKIKIVPEKVLLKLIFYGIYQQKVLTERL